MLGCSRPQVQLPELKDTQVIPEQDMYWKPDGSMDIENAQKAYRQLKAYNIAIKYYKKEILEYNMFRETIIKEAK